MAASYRRRNSHCNGIRGARLCHTGERAHQYKVEGYKDAETMVYHVQRNRGVGSHLDLRDHVRFYATSWHIRAGLGGYTGRRGDGV